MSTYPSPWVDPADPSRAAPRAEAAADVGPTLPPPVALPVSQELRRVVIRLRSGEELEVGRTDGREPAVRVARDTIQLIEDAQRADEWPQVDDRYLRPDAIISVDIQRVAP